MIIYGRSGFNKDLHEQQERFQSNYTNMFPIGCNVPHGTFKWFQMAQNEHQGKYEPNVLFGDHSNDLQRNGIHNDFFFIKFPNL